MSNVYTVWLVGYEYWRCTAHFKMQNMKKNVAHCNHPGCPSVRPRIPKSVMERLYPTISPEDLCSYERCKRGEDGKKAVKREGSKYCCDECRKGNARLAYKMRKQAEKVKAVGNG